MITISSISSDVFSTKTNSSRIISTNSNSITSGCEYKQDPLALAANKATGMISSSISLKLPSTKQANQNSKVTLLCTTEEPTIEGEKVLDMEVSKVLYESSPSNKKVLIFRCKYNQQQQSHVCLKLMDSNEVYQTEKKAYDDMLDEGNGVASLFLKVYFFCEVIMPDKRIWKGYCMQEGKYSVREILSLSSSDPISGALVQKRILQDILKDKENVLDFIILNLNHYLIKLPHCV